MLSVEMLIDNMKQFGNLVDNDGRDEEVSKVVLIVLIYKTNRNFNYVLLQ